MTDMDAPVDLLIGTYETGLHRLRYQPRAEPQWSLHTAAASPANASYGVYSSRHDLWYMIDEQSEGRIVTLRQGDNDQWQSLSSLSSGGAMPCFVGTSPDGRFLAVANYGDGNITVFRLSPETGDIIEPVYSYTHSGHSLNPERQDGPHAHCVRFHGDCLYSTDLGTDEILAHTFSNNTGQTTCALKLPAGQGPRHILFHPDNGLAYILTELGSRVFVATLTDPHRLEIIQHISTLPTAAESLGGHMALSTSGQRLHVTNRGHDSVTTFEICSDGRLEFRANAPSHGASPRHFHWLEAHNLMVVAHEEGDSLVVLKLNREGSVGEPVQSLPIRSPAFAGSTGPTP